MNDEKRKTWVALVMVRPYELEDELNKLADNGYQIHSVHLVQDAGVSGGGQFTVVAVDPAQMAKTQGEALNKTITELMASVKIPGMP